MGWSDIYTIAVHRPARGAISSCFETCEEGTEELKDT